MNIIKTEEEFSIYFFKKLTEIVDDIQLVNINNLEIKTKDKNEETYIHLLYNAYSQYKLTPEDFNEIINQYVKGSATLYEENEEVNIDLIVPIIKDKRFIEESRNYVSDFDENHLFEKYNSELYIFYAQDLPTTISYIKLKDFKKLNISLEKLREKSIENLNSIIENIEINNNNGIYMLIADGNYEASLILFNIWNHQNFPVNGDILVTIPSRDLLFITGTLEEKNIEILKDRNIEINYEGNHIISDKIYIYKNDKFEIFK